MWCGHGMVKRDEQECMGGTNACKHACSGQHCGAWHLLLGFALDEDTRTEQQVGPALKQQGHVNHLRASQPLAGSRPVARHNNFLGKGVLRIREPQ
jgi:hypothetical protein